MFEPLSTPVASVRGHTIYDDYNPDTLEFAIGFLKGLYLVEKRAERCSKETKKKCFKALQNCAANFSSYNAATRKDLMDLKFALESPHEGSFAARFPESSSLIRIKQILAGLDPFVSFYKTQREIPKLPILPPLGTSEDFVAPPPLEAVSLCVQDLQELTFEDDFSGWVFPEETKANSLLEPAYLIPASKEDPILEQQRQFLAQQREYMQRIVTLFLQDYLFNNIYADSDFNLLMQRDIVESIQPDLQRAVEQFCFPAPGKLLPKNKQFIQIIASSGLQFLKHLTLAMQAITAKGIDLQKLSTQSREKLLIKKIARQREKESLPPLLKAESSPKEIKALCVEKIKALIEALNTKKEGEEKSSPLLNIALILISNSAGMLLYKFLQPAFLNIIMERFLTSGLSVKKINKEAPLEYFEASDVDFSETIGAFLLEAANSIAILGEPTGASRYGSKGLISLLASRSKNIGEMIQKGLSRILQSPSRVQLFHFLSLVLWKQDEGQTWEPYLNTAFLKEDCVKQDELEPVLCALVFDTIMGVFNTDPDKSSWYERAGKKLAKGALEKEGSLKDFLDRLTKRILLLTQHHSIMLLLVFYILDGIIKELRQNQ